MQMQTSSAPLLTARTAVTPKPRWDFGICAIHPATGQ